MAEFKYEIIKNLGILSESKSGWTRELNLISWNGADPKFDIRRAVRRTALFFLAGQREICYSK